MKKAFKITAIVLAILIVVALVFFAFRFRGSADIYSGERPCDYTNTKWVLSEPKGVSGYFLVDSNNQCKGEIENENGVNEQFNVMFDFDNGVTFENYDEDNDINVLLSGEVPSFLTYAQFYKDKLVIKNIDKDKIFNKKYDKLVFLKEKMTKEDYDKIDVGNKIVVDNDKSYFDDFNINSDTVNFNYTLTLKNKSNNKINFKICGIFSEDYSSKLINQESLYAINSKDESYVFSLNGNEEKTFNVTFKGEFGGNKTKNDRNLPKLIFE